MRVTCPTVGLLLSGGLDSCILLGHLQSLGNRVQPFYIRTNLCWEEAELASVRKFLDTMRDQGDQVTSRADAASSIAELIVMDLPLDDLYGEHWSVNGHATPDANTDDQAVFLPGRNPLLVIKAALWCAMQGVEQLALAPLEANPFDDAREPFFATYEAALNQAVAGHATCNRVRLVRPFAQYSKRDVMKLGRHLPLELTFSCIRPEQGQHCGQCNKCAERQAAFASIELRDPTCYATVTHA